MFSKSFYYCMHETVHFINLLSVSFFSSFLLSMSAKCFIKPVLCGKVAITVSSLLTRRENLKINITSGWAEHGNRTTATGVSFLAEACCSLSHMETCHHLERERVSGLLPPTGYTEVSLHRQMERKPAQQKVTVYPLLSCCMYVHTHWI